MTVSVFLQPKIAARGNNFYGNKTNKNRISFYRSSILLRVGTRIFYNAVPLLHLLSAKPIVALNLGLTGHELLQALLCPTLFDCFV